ncbi:MAG: response regulator transcription factor [Roseburia sp.]|nr:response regulator transcription factor [Roseburia sp.]MCM1277869.1 response regulator transcription factor [Robinsoniella sp.]
MKQYTILIVEDEKKLLNTISDFLKLNGYRLLTAENGIEAMRQFTAYAQEIDIVLLDIMLPFLNGYELLKEIRMRSNVPVILLTAKSSVEDQIEGFEYGADDYITKPYSLSLIKAHIEAVLKRAGKTQDFMVSGDIRIDVKGQKVYVREEYIETTPKEFELLLFFMENEGMVLSRDRILDAVWGYQYEGDIRTVDTLVKQLRKKLKDGNYIRSIYGIGYVFGGTGYVQKN